jgi:hypothetical protein
MNIHSLPLFLKSTFSIFENQIIRPLSVKQEKVYLVAAAILCGVLSLGFLIYHVCVRAKGSLFSKNPQIDQIKNPIKEENDLIKSVAVQRIQELIKESTTLGKKEACEKLEEAFANLHKVDPNKTEFAPLYIKILKYYGIRLYPQFGLSLQYLLASLQLQLQSVGVLAPIKFDQVTNLKQIQPSSTFESLKQFIQQADEKNYSSIAEKLSDEEKFHFTIILYNLGNIYSNLNETFFKMERAPFVTFLNHLFQGVKNILISMKQTPEVQELLGELQYNIFPRLYLDQCKLKHGGQVTKYEVLEAFRILDQAKVMNPYMMMQARIANLKARYVLECLSDLPSALQYAEDSLKLLEEILKDSDKLSPLDAENFGNLYANVNNNYLSISIKLGNQNIEELEKHAKVAREFYNRAKETHPYSMIIGYNLARLEQIRNNKAQALIYLDEVKKISFHFGEWSTSKVYFKKAVILQKELEKSKT